MALAQHRVLKPYEEVRVRYCWWFRNPANQLIGIPRYTGIPSGKLTVRTWKCMVGILIAFWNRLFSVAMLVSGSVVYPIRVLYIPGGCLGFLPVWSFIVRVCVKWTRYQSYRLGYNSTCRDLMPPQKWLPKKISPLKFNICTTENSICERRCIEQKHHFSVSMLNLRRTFLNIPGVVGVPEGFSNLGFSTRQSPEDRVIGFRNGLGNSECRAGSSGNNPSIKPYFLVDATPPK